MPDPVVILDEDWCVLEVNSVGRNLLKAGPEILGTTLASHLGTPEAKLRQFERQCRRTSSPIPGSLEFRVNSEIVKLRVKGSRIAGVSAPVYLLRIEKPPNSTRPNSAFERLNRKLERIQQNSAQHLTEKLQLQALLDGLPLGLCILNEKGEFVKTNARFRQWLGIAKSRVRGQLPRDCMTGEMLAHFRTAVEQVTMSQEDSAGQVFERVIDGQSVYWLVTEFDVTDPFEGTSQRCYTWVDVSEEKRSEKERENLKMSVLKTQKLESLGVLAGGIAHDFNNILMSILGNAELAAEELESSSRAQVYLADLMTASKRAADLCKQMLAYSGKGRFLVETVSISEVVQEMVELLRVSVSKQATLNLHLDSEVENIRVDATQLRQIIMNLITNASDALSEKSGMINISTGSSDCDPEYLRSLDVGRELEPGRYSWIEVSDTGVGMNRATRERIFDPFFTTKFTGRGLGLSAVLGIIRGHCAALKVYSEVGRGTTFKVLFPVTDSSRTPRPAPISPSVRRRRCGKVLVVDDEDCVRQVAKRAIELQGFEVLEAENGMEALKILERRKFGWSFSIWKCRFSMGRPPSDNFD